MKKVLIFFVLTIAGCGGMPTDALIGQDQETVVRILGIPHSEMTLSQNRALIYPRGPMGKGTFFIQMDRSGNVVGWEDVLTYANFQKIRVGMHADEVKSVIGPSLWQWRVAKDRQTIWNYPFHNSICQIFQIAVTPDGKVAEVGFGFAPECEYYGD